MKKYYKIKDGVRIESDCLTINDYPITHPDGTTTYHNVSNPTDEMIAKAGWLPNVAPAPTPEELLESARRAKLDALAAHDRSEAADYPDDPSKGVNNFKLNGQNMWIPSADRKQFRVSLISLEAEGGTEMPLWYNGVKYGPFPIPAFKELIDKVETYAMPCFNVSAEHEANIKALSTIADIDAYDFTTGYPEQLNLVFDGTNINSI